MIKNVQSVPLLRWAGSKKRQYSAMRAVFPPDFARYIEPFAGSASFLFQLGKGKSAINDLNPDVANFYRLARSEPQSFITFMNDSPRDAETYYKYRSKFNATCKGLDRSLLFYYLNRNCFNGIFRVNKNGEFNVPYASARVAPYLTPEAFERSVNLLKSSDIANEDFENFVVSTVSNGDFVFLDPPYYVANSRIFSEYTTKEFDESDLSRLSKVLHLIDETGAKFLLTYPSSEISRDIAKAWSFHEMTVNRSVAGSATHRRKTTELLIRNYNV